MLTILNDCMIKKKGKTFFELAKRHIAKARPGDDPDLSKKVDEIVYGLEENEKVTEEDVLHWSNEAKQLHKAGKLPRLRLKDL